MNILRTLNNFATFLPALFWISIIYCFDIPVVAGLTIISAIIHECGHILYLLLSSKNIKFRASLNGFRIRRNKNSSYISDIMIYSAGPMMNIAAAVTANLFSASNYMQLFKIINISTAVANLLPIYGYDGYGILSSMILLKNKENILLPLLDIISFSLTALTVILALYILSRVGDSFWLGGLFLFSLIKEVSRGLEKHFRRF